MGIYGQNPLMLAHLRTHTTGLDGTASLKIAVL